MMWFERGHGDKSEQSEGQIEVVREREADEQMWDDENKYIEIMWQRLQKEDGHEEHVQIKQKLFLKTLDGVRNERERERERD